MLKISPLFAAALFLAAGCVSPVLASKCYGLDPCVACRNCHACKHCHMLGGKCGVCKSEEFVGRNQKKNLTRVKISLRGSRS